MSLVNAHNVSFTGSILTNIEGDYVAAAPGERGISELFKASSPDACHDSLARHPPPRCLQGTRASIIQEICDWFATGDERILWLSGPAGSGKSAIAQTIAETCAANFTLGASFFFFGGSSNRNTADRIVATIAHQLAIRIHHKRVLLGWLVEANLSILHKPLQVQFDQLICSVFESKPFDDTSTEHPFANSPQSFLIVFDGVDECKGDQNQREVIAEIGKLAANFHIPFRFLVASRPEPQIRESFDHLSCKFHHISLGDKCRDTENNSDIYKVLRHGFDEIYQMRKLTTEVFWPGNSILQTLVWKSGGAIIYAATVVRYVGDVDHHPVKRLAEILATPPGLTPFTELDSLYSRILGAHPDTTKLREVLTFVCIAKDPFRHVRRIELLLQAEEGEVMVMLRRMQSIINVSDPNNIHCYHKTFTDFIHDKERAGSFFIDWEQGNAFITQELLEFLRTPSRYTCPGKETKELLDYAIGSWWKSCPSSGDWYRLPQLLKNITDTLESHTHPHKFYVHDVLYVLQWISFSPGKTFTEATNGSGIQPGELAKLQLHLSRKLWEFFLQALRKNPFRRLTIVDGTDIDSDGQLVVFCWEDSFVATPLLKQFIQEPEGLLKYNMEIVHGHHKILIQYLAILQFPILGQFKARALLWDHILLEVIPGNQEVLAALKKFERSILRPLLDCDKIEHVRTWLKLSGVKPYGIWRKHYGFGEMSRNTPYGVACFRKTLRYRLQWDSTELEYTAGHIQHCLAQSGCAQEFDVGRPAGGGALGYHMKQIALH